MESGQHLIPTISPDLYMSFGRCVKAEETMCGVYLPRLSLTALHLSAYVLRGATQTECCNISYHGNNLLWGEFPSRVSRALDSARQQRFG